MFRLLTTTKSKLQCQNIVKRFISATPIANGKFEPTDLKETPDIPEYDQIQLVLKGYDFVILEAFSKYVHSIVKRMCLECKLIPFPTKDISVQTFKPKSANVLSQYFIKKYARSFQFDNLPSPSLPILLEMIHVHVPEGVDIVVQKPNPDEERNLYIQSLTKEDLMKQISEMEEAKKRKK
ncbi:hypothetical protein LOTGIDRAFT_239150 [Lottia gigantea]|uniref:Small ribosomal subunit protein uS10 domain-containing protein n=1 Tax=Lottia gigantea TaxID=225164 RepID=V4C8E5_LOTGI|nr:hypothetical protein LOTGIDRAFT_239150 [Lottia gigantea]ESO97999.1 hypothetical protein LOTGIDRAFT_239150 [Lottia gigantea]